MHVVLVVSRARAVVRGLSIDAFRHTKMRSATKGWVCATRNSTRAISTTTRRCAGRMLLAMPNPTPPENDSVTPQAARHRGDDFAKPPDTLVAELLPAVEMAWADGTIQDEERTALEAYCFELTHEVNRSLGATVLTAAEVLRFLDVLLRRRLPMLRRAQTLDWLAAELERRPDGRAARERMLRWCMRVAEVSGQPRWHPLERQWLKTLAERFASGSA
ncbi:MAG: TerB family tellurite resistance protein [Myxococcaceae bacterium]|nr:TerB family tellurite resistance protein [Myxococcaceae bacterium]